MIDHLPLGDLQTKYPYLTDNDILDGVELAAITVIQQTHQAPATAIIDNDGLHITVLRDNSHEDILLSTLKRRVKRRLLSQIELELMERQTYREAVQRMKGIVGSVLAGEVTNIQPNGTIIVHLNFNNAFQHRSIYAECPVAQQPAHERSTYSTGQYLSFMVVACRPVSNHRHAKIQVIVSRIARELPARMLTNLTFLPGIRCIKREVREHKYRVSLIVTRFEIPKEHLVTVGRELKEHLIIIKRDKGTKPPHIKGPLKSKKELSRKKERKAA